MYRHFSVIVVGDNHDALMSKYDVSKKVKPYVVMEYSKAKEYREKAIKTYEEMLKSEYLSEDMKDMMKYRLDFFKDETNSDDDVYLDLTDSYVLDEETGNAISDVNPEGRYLTARIGKNLAMPMIDNNGNYIYQGRKNEISWEKTHLDNRQVYERVWEMCVDGDKPKDDEEKKLYENMKNRKVYFTNFNDKKHYADSNTAFWGYAFVDDEGWHEIDKPQFEWVTDFYDRFIKDLPDNTLITIYECTRSVDE